MKNLKRLLAVAGAVGVLTVTSVVFAADFKTPADIVSGLTGESIESIAAEKSEGKTYGTIAKENDALEEFKAQMLEQKKAILDQRVADGNLTQEQADEIYNAIKENIASCDGSSAGGIGRQFGAGFGNGSGSGARDGSGCGSGNNAGKGMGMGRNGTGCGRR